MPLKKSSSSKAMSANVCAMRREGIPQKQAVAIAMRVKRDAQLRGRSGGRTSSGRTSGANFAWGVFPWTGSDGRSDSRNHGWAVAKVDLETGRGKEGPYRGLVPVKTFWQRHHADHLATELTFGTANKSGRSSGRKAVNPSPDYVRKVRAQLRAEGLSADAAASLLAEGSWLLEREWGDGESPGTAAHALLLMKKRGAGAVYKPNKGRSFGTHVLALAAGYGLARAVDHPDAVKGAARRVHQEGQRLSKTAKESYAAARGRSSGARKKKWDVYYADSEADAHGLMNYLMRKHRTYVSRHGARIYTDLTQAQVLDAAERLGVIVQTESTYALGRSTGHTHESKPVILIEYGILQVDAGWHPVIWENGRDLYHWTPKALDRGEALKHAQREAEHHAKKYVGDWDVRIQPAPEGAKLRSRRKPS